MQILLGTLAYLLVTFPLAILWHMKIFRSQYTAWQYFGEDVMPMLGLASMLVQGIILSFGYSFLPLSHGSIWQGVCYSLVMGLLIWSVIVLATMGKSSKVRHVKFLVLETTYLAIVFSIYGAIISQIY